MTQPLLDLDFRTTYVEGGVLYTPSRGSLVTRAVMGTGVPGNANAPAITPIGASFDGGDWVDTGTVNLLEYNRPFSVVVRGRFPQTAGDPQVLLSNYNGHAQYVSWFFYSASNEFRVGFADVLGGSIVVNSQPTTPRDAITMIATGDGSGTAAGVYFYLDGRDAVQSRGGTGLLASVQDAPFRIGAHAVGGSVPVYAGTKIRRIQVYPFAMTPAQVRAVHERFEREGES